MKEVIFLSRGELLNPQPPPLHLPQRYCLGCGQGLARVWFVCFYFVLRPPPRLFFFFGNVYFENSCQCLDFQGVRWICDCLINILGLIC